jgi:peptidoglycan/LPS O-acetylase OafA/YrhL
MLTFTRLPAQWTGFAATVGWTLHAEFWFYVFFPILFMLMYKRGLLSLAIGFLIIASILSKIFAGHGEPGKWPIGNDQWYMVLYLDQMMYGALCAILIARHPSFVQLFTSKWWLWGGLIIILTMARLFSFNVLGGYWYLGSSGAALLCAIAILHHEANPKSSKDNFIAWIGRISFSIYLVHAIVLDYVPTGKLLPKLDTPLMVGIVLVVSWLTEKYVERPGIRLSKWLAPLTSKSTSKQALGPEMATPFS